ncbi:hypothetical protein ASF88_04050 [Leifsonia sp. Leaf336]|uniref:hypothetical protein n=1 Tax=Leifsonia sp. Leaf336 TaxID=1736341 RepID=UPI0007016D67|nr:hypothetical protein [Leifsonia sp. Leaf336]KQR54019.1 hypothetical protein ASF88_04050 [Leifsonia sp. Leaf336]
MSTTIVVVLASFVVALALALAVGAVIVRASRLQNDRARAAALTTPAAWSALAGISLAGYADDERVRSAVDAFLAAGRAR